MATKKYLSLDRLIEYDTLIKGEITSSVNGKADALHSHDDKYYTESEIDAKIASVNTSITNITSGTVAVKEAEHANTATTANSSTTANSATKATQDANGNVITDTYETKEDASAKLEEAKLYTDTEISEIYIPFEKASSVGTVNGRQLTIDLQQFIDTGATKGYNFANDTNTGVVKFVLGDLFHVGTNCTTFSIQVRTDGNDAMINIYLRDEEIIFQHMNGVSTVERESFAINSNVLVKYNTTEYTPTSDYHPATKKYVDDTVANIDLTSYETTENANIKLEEAKGYTDTAVANLVNSAPETLDTLGEIANAMKENKDVVDALNNAIGNKADIEHNHDDKYYTESEIDSKLSGKSDTSHTHTITADASDDDVVVLTGTNGTNKVTYSASHANSGVTAGTYKSVTVNAKGHITAGTNPTTLSGFGITDAYTKTQIDNTVSGLNTAINGKAPSSHGHTISEITNLQTTLDGKANTSHGNHVPTTQASDNATFLRNDNTWQKVTPANIGAALSSHVHTISDITNLQTTLNNASSAISANTSSINSHTTKITALENKVGDGFEEATSAEIQALFA